MRVAVASLILGLAISARAQPATQEATEAPQIESPAAPTPAPGYRPGFLDMLGRWFGGSTDAIGSGIKSTGETIGALGSQAAGAAKGAAGIAQDAAGTVVALPGTRIITGRHVCPLAPNGAPDCALGVEAMCRGQGFTGGRHLDIATSQRCSTKGWLSRGTKKDSECRVETFVTRAVCQ